MFPVARRILVIGRAALGRHADGAGWRAADGESFVDASDGAATPLGVG